MFYNLIPVQITHISYSNYISGYLFKRKNSVLLSHNNNLHIGDFTYSPFSFSRRKLMVY